MEQVTHCCCGQSLAGTPITAIAMNFRTGEIGHTDCVSPASAEARSMTFESV